MSVVLVPIAAYAGGEREAWYKVLFSDTPVGLARERWVAHNDESYYESHLEMHMSRLGEQIGMLLYAEETDDVQGRTVRFRTETRAADVVMRITGEMMGDSLHIKTEGEGYVDRVVLAWEDGAIGSASLDDYVAREFAQGEKDFTVRVFDPQVAAFATYRFVVRDRTTSWIEGRPVELTVIDQYVDNSSYPSITLWADDEFDVQKILMRQMGIEITIERITLEAFTNLELDPNFDIIRRSMIPCTGYPASPHRLASVTFELTFSQPLREAIVVDGPNQRVRSIDDSTIEVIVSRAPLNEERTDAAQLERYLRSDRYIQSNHAMIRSVADSVAEAAGLEGLALAQALAIWVNTRIEDKNFGQGFATAVDACTSGQGDCTEHSVLLAALLRAAGIPARVVVGLAYSQGHFIGHMWTEAYVDYWHTLDALNVGNDPVRIRVALSPDERAVSETDLVNVYSVVGGLAIEVTDFETNE